MFPTAEQPDTTLGTGRSFDEAGQLSTNDLPVTAGEAEELSEFERRIASTGILLRNAGIGCVKGCQVARRHLSLTLGILLTWSRIYGLRLTRFAQCQLSEFRAWSSVTLPRFTAACSRQAVTFAHVAAPAIHKGATRSMSVVEHGTRIGWRGVRATGSGVRATGKGSLTIARRCLTRSSKSVARRRQHTPVRNVHPPQSSLQSTAHDAWVRAQDQTEQARAEFREAREAYEGAILRQIMERRLGVQVFPRYPEVVVDGLHFALRWHPPAEEYELTLLTSCPGCGGTVASGDILHLADLGAVLDDVAAGRNRCLNCRHPQPPLASASDTDELDRVIAGPGMNLSAEAPPAGPSVFSQPGDD